MRLHGEAAARAMGGALEGPPGMLTGVLTGVSIDSRTLAPGDLFFAIRGPRHDGHAFVADAFRRGARGAVVESDYRDRPAALPETTTGRFLIRVSDPTEALGALAREERLKSGVRIVAITGSLGKTTTKEAAAAAIGAGRSVFCSPGNLNNQWGLPLSLLAREEEEVGVVELGMSAPGEIRTLTEIAEPDVGLVTNIAEAHLEFFGSVEAIADAKGELFGALPAHATAVVNAEDEQVLAQAKRFRGKHVTYAFDVPADIKGVDRDPLAPGLSFSVQAFGDEPVPISCCLRGRHNASNVLAGLAAAAVLEVPLDDAAKGVASLKALPGRGQRIELPNGAMLVDETYNSSPRALKTVLHELHKETAVRSLPGVNARLVLVVGDMLELGDDANELHRKAGHFVYSQKTDWVVGVGSLGQVVAQTANALGTPASYVDGPEEAAELLSGELRLGDVVLFKASRAVGMERAIQALQAASEGGA